AQRELRQGDPFSPFLFLLAMEGLNNMIKSAKVRGWLRGIEVSGPEVDSVELTHLQYVDDTLMLCDAEEGQLKILRSKTLRMKWLWKFNNEEHTYWKEITKVKYVEEDNWMTKEVTTPYGVSVWRSIRSLWLEFKANTKIKVGNGETTEFLEGCLA
ncbi:hypothetical protein MTR67_040635, partial [Solanum verrucosum]